jgi:hypothetical protein
MFKIQKALCGFLTLKLKIYATAKRKLDYLAYFTEKLFVHRKSKTCFPQM